MDERTIFRLRDIVDAIDKIDLLLREKSFADMLGDPFMRAAFERFLEILSEASRHIPREMKDMAPDIEWRRIADIGNHIRHAYHRVDAEILWRLYADGQLARLREVTAAFAEHLEPK